MSLYCSKDARVKNLPRQNGVYRSKFAFQAHKGEKGRRVSPFHSGTSCLIVGGGGGGRGGTNLFGGLTSRPNGRGVIFLSLECLTEQMQEMLCN